MIKLPSKKWIPKILSVSPDGGKDSGVTAYFLIEWKPVFSIAILHFKPGTREAYHNHAFNALTWWLKGNVTELSLDKTERHFKPSLKPKFTPWNNFHKILAHENTYALTLRGPWYDWWMEFKDGKFTMYTHGRKEIKHIPDEKL